MLSEHGISRVETYMLAVTFQSEEHDSSFEDNDQQQQHQNQEGNCDRGA
jgi:hypothetical protein